MCIQVHAAALMGTDAVPVTVEASILPGVPGLSIVGMAAAATLEARSRIRCAMRACGFEVPRESVVVSLSPGDIRKTGSGFDLPIAAAVLAATGQIPVGWLPRHLLAGELSADGLVLPVRGTEAFRQLAQPRGVALVTGEGAEAAHHGCMSVRTLADLRRGTDAMRSVPPVSGRALAPRDFSDIDLPDGAKRGIAVAVAGRHGIALVGGTPQRRLSIARSITAVMGEMTAAEELDVARIQSVAGERLSIPTRPFRSPSPTISCAGLAGGGRPVRPGEASLAHAGVLYLEDAHEWSDTAMRLLFQSRGTADIVRSDGVYRMPADFQLVVGVDACPCGGYGQPGAECACSERRVSAYRRSVASRLRNLVPVAVDVSAVEEGVMSTRDMHRIVARAKSLAGKPCEESDGARGFIESVSPEPGLRTARLKGLARWVARADGSLEVSREHAVQAAAMMFDW